MSASAPLSSSPPAVDRLLEAVHFAAVRHRGQRRNNAEAAPYINHPVGVAHLLLREAGVTDPQVLCAAVLHDTLEDTQTTFEELVTHFGPEIAGMVRECTDDPLLPKAGQKRRQVETMPGKSPGARLVKLADKLYNLRDLQAQTPTGWSREKVEGYFQVGREVAEAGRGTNAALDRALDEVFAGEFLFEGQRYPCLPAKAIAACPTSGSSASQADPGEWEHHVFEGKGLGTQSNPFFAGRKTGVWVRTIPKPSQAIPQADPFPQPTITD